MPRKSSQKVFSKSFDEGVVTSALPSSIAVLRTTLGSFLRNSLSSVIHQTRHTKIVISVSTTLTSQYIQMYGITIADGDPLDEEEEGLSPCQLNIDMLKSDAIYVPGRNKAVMTARAFMAELSLVADIAMRADRRLSS